MLFNRVLTGLAAGVVLAVPVAVSAPATAATAPTVVGIAAAHHDGFDRVVFRLTALPTERSVRYVTQVVSDPKGSKVDLLGKQFAVVRLFSAAAHDADGATAPERVSPKLSNLREIAKAGDFEGVVTYGIGLRERVPLHLFTLQSPPRVIVDVPVLSWPELKQGARNPNVTAAQYLLQARGYKLGADGVFGPMTRASVTAFEKSLNLAVNGTIARPEWVAMLASVRYGSHGVVVRALQVLLRKNAIQVTVDGMFGQLTRAAVERAQRLNALPVNGVVERSTWKALVCRGNAE